MLTWFDATMLPARPCASSCVSPECNPICLPRLVGLVCEGSSRVGEGLRTGLETQYP